MSNIIHLMYPWQVLLVFLWDLKVKYISLSGLCTAGSAGIKEKKRNGSMTSPSHSVKWTVGPRDIEGT